ncbi:DNA-binding response regulator [Nocardioides luteus]|uniref:DNA-binding response regulator n=1 Tax=Nocardioides luteus TaxID=1844 RepID=A0ABQ5SX55_9ACTN|nr:DNA-binding response regulator [Nocardioides luteus]GLJ68238.1 DNA-binding response regulator [Nocardioides luteus]
MALSADETMTLDAVRVALEERDITVTATAATGADPADLLLGEPATWLVVTDIDEWAHLERVCALFRGVRLPGVALTTAPRGGLWGALLEAGAVEVLAADADSDTIEGALRDAADGRRGHTPVEVEGLVAQWHLMREGRERMRRLVASLTAREREVLELLYAGDTVAEIAEHFGVAQTTERTQVKSILRKFEVGSQLAAVAAYDRFLRPPRS